MYQRGALVVVFVYSRMTTPEALLIGGMVVSIFVNGMMGGYGALMAELHPTHASRHRAQPEGAHGVVACGPIA